MDKQPAKIWKCPTSVTLECGVVIDDLQIAYHTYGTLAPDGSNAVWVCHALTADSEVADWWPHTVEAGKFLDPEKWFVVCANVLGSHYGTTGPLTHRASGSPRYGSFPRVTIRDMVECHRLLSKHLGISSIKMLIGSSLGGFQCMEWAITDPTMIRNLVLIATAPITTPWAAAFNESQRMAILNDPTFGHESKDAGLKGMGVARSIALLSYRGPSAYNATQADSPNSQSDIWKRRVHSYQNHQAHKLEQRFNAYSYMLLSQAVDSHNVGRGRGGICEALGRITARTLVVSITSDILFPPEDHRLLIDCIKNTRFSIIDSHFGHDGFLIEHNALDKIIKEFLKDDREES